jgi:ribonuclease VapC
LTIFADASALVTIVARETEAAEFARCLESDSRRLCSALSAWEAVAGLSRSYVLAVPAARARLRLFLGAMNFTFVGIGETEFEIASEAYARFGKGRHPAALNMCDCFAYACARANGARLLFKGEDFARTDIESAMG